MRTLIVVGLLIAASAYADDRGAAREHFSKGTKAFDLGLYDVAITEYMAAYQAKDDPALLYNIAQTHRLAGHATDALRFYRIYLTKLPRAQNHEDVEHKIVELQKVIEQQEHAKTSLPPDQVIKPVGEQKPEAAEEVAPPMVAGTGVAPTEPSTEPSPRTPSRALKVGGVATLAVGVVVLGVGGAMAGLASHTADSFNASPSYDPQEVNRYHLDRNVEWTFLAVGAAATIAGVICYAIGAKRSSPSLRASLAPAPSGGTVALVGAW